MRHHVKRSLLYLFARGFTEEMLARFWNIPTRTKRTFGNLGRTQKDPEGWFKLPGGWKRLVESWPRWQTFSPFVLLQDPLSFECGSSQLVWLIMLPFQGLLLLSWGIVPQKPFGPSFGVPGFAPLPAGRAGEYFLGRSYESRPCTQLILASLWPWCAICLTNSKKQILQPVVAWSSSDDMAMGQNPTSVP